MQKLVVVFSQLQSKKRRSILLTTMAKLVFMVVLLAAAPAKAQTYGFNSNTARLTVVQPLDSNNTSTKGLICMALNIYHEARGSTSNNQLAVGLVTMNRVRRTGKSICDVVYERRGGSAQFTWTNKPAAKTRYLEIEAWDRAQLLAHHVIYEKPRDITKGATYFHERTVQPVWTNRAREKTVIGAHVFVRLEEIAEARPITLP